MLTLQYWIPQQPRNLLHEDGWDVGDGTPTGRRDPHGAWSQWHLLGAAIAFWAFQGSTTHMPTELRTLGTTCPALLRLPGCPGRNQSSVPASIEPVADKLLTTSRRLGRH